MDVEESQHPLLSSEQSLNNDNDQTMTPAQSSLKRAFESTAHLANHLPTGTVLAFQVLSPIFTNQGHCTGVSNQTLTAYLMALCALSCFVLSFTDSVRDEAGNVRYGIATLNGLWIIDGTTPLQPEIGAKYRLLLVDFVHAVTAVLIFAAVALCDQNVISCFNSSWTEETKQMLALMPVGIGVVGSMLFVNFPTTRHGIGLPLTAH